MKKRLLIFDFDGTIVDSKAAYYSAMVRNLKKYGFSSKEVDEVIDIGLSLKGTLRKLGLNLIYIWWIKKKIMKDVLNQVNKVKKCKDVSQIKKIKMRKILVSNSLSGFILPVLRHLKLKRYFKETYGAEAFGGFDDKMHFIKHYLKKNKINPKDCYYIGDRAADVRIAKGIGCKAIAISSKCSWDSRKEILAENPDFIIDDLEDVNKIV